MERRRQKASQDNHLQPLGRPREQPKRTVNAGFGEELGNTEFKSKKPAIASAPRPKIAPNPAAKAKQNSRREHTPRGKLKLLLKLPAAATPPQAGSDSDPIDFISSQEKAPTTNTRPPSRAAVSSNKPGPQPPPFSKQKSLGVSEKPRPVPKPVPTSSTASKRQLSHRKMAIESDESDDSCSSRPTTRSKTSTSTPPPPSSQPPSSEEREPPVKPSESTGQLR
jgi:hypothetical protein